MSEPAVAKINEEHNKTIAESISSVFGFVFRNG
jgi:hypothetical protein